MKALLSLTLGALLSFNVLAALSPQEQKMEGMLLSGDLAQAKRVAKAISSEELFNPELLDIVAEILLRSYPDARPSEVDAVAWLARSLGFSENGRYHAVLKEVVTSTGIDKLERHADSALDDLGDASGEQYQRGMYTMAPSLYAPVPKDARNAQVTELIMAGDLRSLKQAAITVYETNIQDQAILDMLAEILLREHADAPDRQIDTLSWVSKALGQSESGRYAAVLAEVEENGAHRKLRGYAEDSLENHGDAQGEQYQQGMVTTKLGTYDF
ncbi:hypothetical protein [Alteromonas halophila]|uniref:HEAT repeat domain-containing protein n=1 Tax=Alteromonas halophila TaxID=516698 RepID=A0A918JKQ7_9ALTE|nr:hypothetical protein [Alteromonas halophila]GGW84951.1 hypothetical protein GCM10007391_18440 [Alteromonas halophila]